MKNRPCAGLLLLMAVSCSCDEDQKKPAEQETESVEVPPPASAAAAIAPKPGRALYPVGEPATNESYRMTVKNVKECETKIFRPKKGNIHIGAELLIENRSDKEMPINPFYNKLSDDEGYGYNISLKGCTPDLKAVRLDPGEKARGWITFEVPEKSKGLRLTYRPALGPATKFALGR